MSDREFSNRLQGAINDFDKCVHSSSNSGNSGSGGYYSSGYYMGASNDYGNDNDYKAFDNEGIYWLNKSRFLLLIYSTG